MPHTPPDKPARTDKKYIVRRMDRAKTCDYIVWVCHCQDCHCPDYFLALRSLGEAFTHHRENLDLSSWKSQPVMIIILTCHHENFGLLWWKPRYVTLKISPQKSWPIIMKMFLIKSWLVNQISILTFHNKTSLNLSRYISNTHNKILTYHNVSRPFVIKSRNGVPQKLRLKYFCKQSIKSVIKNQNMWNTFLEMPLLTDSLLPRQQFVFWYPTLTRVFVKAVIT